MRINIKSADAINTALARAHKGARTHTFTHFDELVYRATLAEEKLSTYLSKHEMAGARLIVESGDKLPNAYKGRVIRSRATLERGTRDWFLVDISRFTGWNTHTADHITITTTQRDAAINRLDRLLPVLEEII